MKLLVSAQTDVGLKRENNQDRYLIDESLGLYIVADGMGGHQGGEVASRLSVETIQTTVQESFEKDAGISAYELIKRAYSRASLAIYEKSQATPSLRGMGTTTVAALYRQNTLYIGNVGDSRAYLIHPPFIWQITDDHSLLNEQIRAGLLKPENAEQFAAKNVITRSVGFEKDVQCDILERELQLDDHFLICSDGLSGLVDDRRLCDMVLTVPFNQVVPRLVEEAKRNGGDDNVTCLLLKAVPDEN